MTRVLAVGMGNRGRKWVRWATAAGAQVVGLVDSNPEVLAGAGAELGVDEAHRFTSVPAAAANRRPDAAVICAPHHVHPVLVRTCLELGLHVLVEKPLAQDMATARGLVQLAAGKGLQLVVAQQYRYSEAVRRLRELVQSGAIGRLTSVLVQFFRWRPTEGMKLPILLNQAIHHFDGMRYILAADPTSCIADLWDPEWNGCDGPTTVEATFRFPGGCRVHYSGSYVAKGPVTPFDSWWRFEGSGGQLVYDGESTILYTPAGGETQAITVKPRKSDTTVELCRDFLRSVETGHPAPTSGEANLPTLAMAFAVALSSEEGRRVMLDELLTVDPTDSVMGGKAG